MSGRRRSGILAVVVMVAGWLPLGGLLGAGVASAQGVEAVGTRALGMGGAFVAVADDATAVYWNPAGLPRSGLINGSVEWQSVASGTDDDVAFGNSLGGSSALVAFSTPPLGLSYYRLRTTQLSAPGGGAEPAGEAVSLVTHHVGGSIVQSIGEYLDVATTVRFVRGVASAAPRDDGLQGEGALDRAADLAGHGSQTIDLDLGAMLVVGGWRAGLLVRNLREPDFASQRPVRSAAHRSSGTALAGGASQLETGREGVALTLDRQVRLGAAWQSPSATTIVACDVDATRTDSVTGPRRHVAVGGERWWLSRRLGTRAGLRVNTLNDAEPVGTAGVSVRATGSLFLDAQMTRGAENRDRSWGIALRFGY